MSRTTTLSVPCRKNYLAPTVEFVRTLAGGFGLPETPASLLGLAVEEAMANVIEHGYRGGSDETMTLKLREAPGRIEISLREMGMPFDPAALPDYTPGGEGKGLGLHLMRGAVDEVCLRMLGQEGKETLLVKRLPGGRIDALAPDALGAPGTDRAARPREKPAPVPFTVRHPRPEEAVAISRLAWSAYGYGYDDYIYHPEVYNDLLARGALSAYVGVADETGEIMGHFAVKRPTSDTPLPEMGAAFVSPAFRGSGVFDALNRAAIAEIEASGVLGYWIHAVTSHPASQRAGSRYKMTPSALQLAMLDDTTFRGLSSSGQRESMLCMAHCLDRTPRTMHVPPAHREMVQRILDWQGIEREFAPPEQARPCAGPGKLTAGFVSPRMHCAVMEIEACGGRTVQEIRQRVEAMRRGKVDAVQLALPLDDPAAPELTTACEDMGFFFAGMTPFGLHGRDALQLQYLNMDGFDPGRLRLGSPEAEELLAYVLDRAREAEAL